MISTVKRFLNADKKIQKVSRRLFRPLIELVFYDLIEKYRPVRKILLLQTPEHNNLGDHAIALAEKMWLEDNYPQYAIIEFSFDDIKFRFNAIKRIVSKDDIIILPGGGNFGDLYTFEEVQRRKIIKSFTENKIIIMPQSINYSSTESGNKQLSKTKRVLDLHKDLTIVCRDEVSFNFAKTEFLKNKILLCPDIVHYMHGLVSEPEQRDGVLLSFRNDKEKVMSSSTRERIESFLESRNITFVFQDTVINECVYKENREQKIKEVLSLFAKSKLIITDRFHGVVFSVITDTPCIVFKSLDHKISEGIKWYTFSGSVRCIDEKDFDSFSNTFTALYEFNNTNRIELKSEVMKRLKSLIGNLKSKKINI